MNKFRNIILEQNAETAIIYLNRPEKGNAFNRDAINELLTAFRQMNAEDSLRFIVIKSTGKNFCTGADLEWMAQSINLNYQENFDESHLLAELFFEIYKSGKITVSAVQGACVGGGVGLAAASDFVLISHDTWFAFSEVRLGLVPATISPYIFYRMGPHNAKRMMLTGERISSDTAIRMHLADEISSPEKLDELLDDLLARLKAGGKVAQHTIKHLIRNIIPFPDMTQLNVKTAGIIADTRVSPEGQEGVKAFLEKRKPNWK